MHPHRHDSVGAPAAANPTRHDSSTPSARKPIEWGPYPDPVRGGYLRFAKRAFDIFFATVGLVILAPVIAVAMVFTRLVVGRPILARQFRVGRDGRPFEMLRLRTKVARRSLDLSANAVESGTSGWRVEFHRPPVTQRIRRTRIDVLPQLWNVITGDMSLVGPRPMVWQDAVEARVLDHPRHSVRPGLTGPGQVRGRGDESLAEQLEVEAAYAQRVTLRGDLGIVGRTLLVMVRPSLRE